jgi:hypothetical protein
VNADGKSAALVLNEVDFVVGNKVQQLKGEIVFHADGTYTYKRVEPTVYDRGAVTASFNHVTSTLHIPVAVLGGRRYFGDIILHNGGHYFNFLVDAACGFGPYYPAKQIACEAK